MRILMRNSLPHENTHEKQCVPYENHQEINPFTQNDFTPAQHIVIKTTSHNKDMQEENNTQIPPGEKKKEQRKKKDVVNQISCYISRSIKMFG